MTGCDRVTEDDGDNVTFPLRETWGYISQQALCSRRDIRKSRRCEHEW